MHQQCGLACAVCADEAHCLAVGDSEGNTIKCLGSVRVGKKNVIKCDKMVAHTVSSCTNCPIISVILKKRRVKRKTKVKKTKTPSDMVKWNCLVEGICPRNPRESMAL